MDDKEIIGLYFARSEQALTETEKKYGPYCHSIAYHILENHDDSKECVNDAYLRVWNAIPPEKPTNFRAFIGKITRNLALGRYRADHTQKRGGCVEVALEELRETPLSFPPDEAIDRTAFLELINAFLEDLSPQARVFFLRRYWYFSSVKEIADDYRVSVNNVKVSLLRSRNALKARLEKEGIPYDK